MAAAKKSKSSWSPDPNAYCPQNLQPGDSYLIYVPEQRVIEIHLLEKGYVDQVIHYPNGSTTDRRSFCGLLTLSSSGMSYVPSSPLEELFPFAAGDVKEATLTSQDSEKTTHHYRLEFTKKSNVIIGKCRYDTIEIQCYAGYASSPYGLSHTHTVDYSPEIGFPLTHRTGRHGNVLADREIRPIGERAHLLSILQSKAC